MTHDRFEQMRRLRAGVGALEQQLAHVFSEARDAVRAGVKPRPPPEPAARRAPPSPDPDATPSMGWQGPPPPNAPRLEAENLTPEEAQQRLRAYVADLRAVAHAFDNCGKLVGLLADLVEHAPGRMRHQQPPRASQAATQPVTPEPTRQPKRQQPISKRWGL